MRTEDVRAPTTLAVDTSFKRIVSKFTRKEVTVEERQAIDNLMSNSTKYKVKGRAGSRTVYDDFVANIIIPMGVEVQSGLSIEEKFDIYCKVTILHAYIRQHILIDTRRS